jgi:DNA helicase-2/ATP-dependent DNA helicase PcrA
VRFFEQAHIKDVVAFLRIVVNSKDEPAWKRVLKTVPSVGKASALRIWDRIAASDDPVGMMERADFGARLKAKESWKNFVDLLKQLMAPAVAASPALQIELVLNSFYRDHLFNAYENANTRAEDLQQLANYAGRYPSTDEFLSELSLISSERFSSPEATAGEDSVLDEDDDERIVLTSIHQAKGLEWRYVFLLWAADGKFPSARALKEADAVEEERRLFYVAITRAKDEFHAVYPLIEADYSRMSVVQRPSRFVSEVPEDLFELWQVDG